MNDGLKNGLPDQPPGASVPGGSGGNRKVAAIPGMPTTWRGRVSERLGHRPILRLIVLNPVSAGIVILMLLAVFVFGVSLFKVWRATPPGFRPVVRISLMDYAQAWSLRRSAEKSLAEGDGRAAMRSYMNAAQNNLGDVGLVRRALEVLVMTAEPGDSKLVSQATETADWLLMLSRTNQNDVFLAARAYDAIGDSYAVLRLLEPSEGEVPEGLYGAMAKARFDSGDANAFGEWWDKAGEEERSDPVLVLYHAAWKAGWGNADEAASYRRQLEEAAETLDQRYLAGRLLLRVTRQRGDVEGYRVALERLESFQGDRMADHVGYWTMLRTARRGDEAVQLARRHPYPPRHPLEASQFGLVLSELADTEAAREMLERYAPTLGNGPAVFCLPLWALLGDLYIADKAWQKLANMGKDIRSLPYGNITMAGFGWFVEGRALVELGDRQRAAEMFDAAVREGFSSSAMSLEVGTIMLQVGFPAPARQVLLPLEESLGDEVRYWQALFEATFAQRDDEALLFKAARRAMDLEPENPIRRLNYAVALMLTRQRPEEAVRLTLEYVNANRSSVLAQLNHAHALAMVGRGGEAARILERIPVPTNPESLTILALVELEISLARRDENAAREALERIDKAFLFPAQIQWLAEVRRQLGQTRGD